MLVFTKTAGYRHDSIPAAIEALRTLGATNGFAVDATEDAAAFTKARLARYGAVVFLLTTGDVLDDAQQAAFTAYIRSGGGFVGVHSAADTERDWPWYGRLVGAWSSGHPEIQAATIDVVSPRDVSTVHLPARWARTDEWYGFLSNPRRNGVRVLLTLDEATYQPRDWAMGADHPIAWKHEFDGGRAWYTQGGHTEESYAEPLFVRHLLGGIRHALGGASLLAPTIRSLNLTVRGGRVLVSLRAARCAPLHRDSAGSLHIGPAPHGGWQREGLERIASEGTLAGHGRPHRSRLRPEPDCSTLGPDHLVHGEA